MDDTAAFARDLEAVLAAGDVAAVLLRLTEADQRTTINRIKNVAAIVHCRDIALLVDGRPEIVARADADGAHLTGIEALRAALPTLKPGRIAGAGGLHSRHDAMLAGEADADYVMFGEPDHGGSGGRPSLESLVERLTWWAELFQPPCIGYAAGKDEVRALAEAGADFVALGEWIWTQRGESDRAVVAASDILAAIVA
ncbi:MAG: thiamine phosphate synthase [Acetobacteraceae bacterium]|nr:thiamine phosphate synthase [Acetobacteraceae bacterium]